MAIAKTRKLYEILWRFDGDTLKGVHQIDLETVHDEESGEVFSHRALDPKPITAAAAAEALSAKTLQLSNAVIERDARISELEAQLLKLSA